MSSPKINKADRQLAKVKYDVTDEQLREAEKLYYRSSMSWLSACNTVKNKSKSL